MDQPESNMPAPHWVSAEPSSDEPTDDAAAMYRATGRASQAKYVSDVMDAKAVSKFGRLRHQFHAPASRRLRSIIATAGCSFMVGISFRELMLLRDEGIFTERRRAPL